MFLNESLQRIQEICQLKKGQRPQSEIEWLASTTKSIKVFNDIILSQGFTGYYSVCQYLNYEYFSSNDCLFKYGDIASKFYVILEGKISIQVPIPNTNDYQEVATFESGSSFGELALESSKPRNASIFCIKACHFLSLEKKHYFKFIRRVITEKKEDIKEFIQNLPLFKSVSKNALFKLAFAIKEASFVKGQTVFKEGETAKNIFIIREGEIKLKKIIHTPVFVHQMYWSYTQSQQESFFEGWTPMNQLSTWSKDTQKKLKSLMIEKTWGTLWILFLNKGLMKKLLSRSLF